MTKDDGLVVTCHAWGPKKQDHPHQASRVNCIVATHEHCSSCPNSKFVLHLPINIGDQPVACPRWDESLGHSKGKPASSYVKIRREICLRIRPFNFCMECPNSASSNSARSKDGWYEVERRGNLKNG